MSNEKSDRTLVLYTNKTEKEPKIIVKLNDTEKNRQELLSYAQEVINDLIDEDVPSLKSIAIIADYDKDDEEYNFSLSAYNFDTEKLLYTFEKIKHRILTEEVEFGD